MKNEGHIELGIWNEKPLSWRVLCVEDGRALLIADEIVRECVFNSRICFGNKWSGSDLKEWLESEFASEANLPSIPFILDADEARRYFDSDEDRICGENG